MNEIPLFLMELAIATGLFVGLIFLIMRLRGKDDFKLFLNCWKRQLSLLLGGGKNGI